MQSKFIFNPHTGIPTILAANRAKRPDQTGVVAKKKEEVSSIAGKKEEKKKEKVDFFAKGNEHMTPPTLYQDQEDWNVRVFDNKYKLLEDHEVIVHSPDPIGDLEDFSCEQVEEVVCAWLNRTDYYGSQGKEVIIFNNRGGKAGASLTHPHSQIVAAQGFPGIIEKEKREALKYFNATNHCMWCDELKKVLKQEKRVVYESSHFVAFIPKACRWSYEMRIIPKEHKPNFGFINEDEIQDFAMLLKAVLSAYDALFDRPDRNFWIHTVMYEPYHWHVGLMVHLNVLGGLELGAGIWVSSKATPEDAAAQLREYVVPVCEVSQIPRGHTLKEN